jgi:hypothetical protein
VTCAEERLSLVRETGKVRIDFDMSLIAPRPHLHALPFRQRESAQVPGRFQCYLTRPPTPYPVAGGDRNHFKLCDFALVTPATLLY